MKKKLENQIIKIKPQDLSFFSKREARNEKKLDNQIIKTKNKWPLHFILSYWLFFYCSYYYSKLNNNRPPPRP